MGLTGSFPRLQGALTQLGWVSSSKVSVLDTLQLSTLCAYKFVQSLRPCVTGIPCSFFFPNTRVYRYYSFFLTSHTCHLITTIVVLTLDFAEFVILPRTSCFFVAYTPSWLKPLVFSATYMSPYLFSFIVFCSVNNISGVFSCPFVLLGCVPRTSKVDMACLVALNDSLRLHNYVIFILREQRLSNYEF